DRSGRDRQVYANGGRPEASTLDERVMADGRSSWTDEQHARFAETMQRKRAGLPKLDRGKPNAEQLAAQRTARRERKEAEADRGGHINICVFCRTWTDEHVHDDQTDAGFCDAT